MLMQEQVTYNPQGLKVQISAIPREASNYYMIIALQDQPLEERIGGRRMSEVVFTNYVLARSQGNAYA